ncbi:bifunctional DNA primase/polymerase [Pimelobacter simplex]|uniref:bifunctional DNA primase/polymerase n=1 Tax=Nocardioides simplex TaxID=2045 RepID=UPI00382A5D3C
MTSRLDYALAYARAGYRVFPVVIFKDDNDQWVKAPRSKRRGLVVYCERHDAKTLKACGYDCKACVGGHNAATTDPEVIRRYWSGRNSQSHVGVLPPEGVVIIDDDSRVFDKQWADRPRVQTASCKSHYYFRLAEGQDALTSENQIEYAEPDGLIDTRFGDGKRYVFAPCGSKHYTKVNGFTADPKRLPVLPAEVYERLLVAPRRATGGGVGGPGDGHHSPGVQAAIVGNAYDRRPGAIEALLEAAGWEDAGCDRWVRPGGSRPSAAVSERDGVWFVNVFSLGDDVLLGGHYYTASMLRCVFEFGGRWKRHTSCCSTRARSTPTTT